MKIAVVGGTGAMGGVWAGLLHGAGHEAWILGRDAAAVATIRRDGLTLELTGQTPRTLPVPAATDAAEIGPCDAVILLTKAHQTGAAIRGALAAVGPETLVLSLQNGWGNGEALAEAVPPERIALGVTYRGGTLRAPGRVLATLLDGPTVIGPFVDGAPLARLERIGTAMTAAGIATTVTSDVKAAIWSKLILNAAGVTLAALTRLPTGAMAGDPELEKLATALIREGVAVAAAQGYAIDAAERARTLFALWAAGGAGRASMLQDVEARRRTEIDAINGAIVREGAARGIEVPWNRAIVALIHGLERGWAPGG